MLFIPKQQYPSVATPKASLSAKSPLFGLTYRRSNSSFRQVLNYKTSSN
jgi:hypothetical protein